ncbi:hypothetical protein BKA82DRAFT_4357363 [Pisolithus tinctorius]|nr:hypothetical protein BKA82DRAFT_4357363 [Pisolithus tinctorius]
MPPLRPSPRLLQPCPATTHLPLSSVYASVDEMAAQTLTYMNTFEEHASIVRGHREGATAYQRMLNEQQVLSPDTAWPLLDSEGLRTLRCRMEDIIRHPATSIDDHLRICCAANTLLLLQHDVISRLSIPESDDVEKKINQLRSERRRAKYMAKRDGFRPVVPTCLPTFQRPQSQLPHDRITTDTVDRLIDLQFLSQVIGQQFYLNPDNTFFRIHAIEASSDGF